MGRKGRSKNKEEAVNVNSSPSKGETANLDRSSDSKLASVVGSEPTMKQIVEEQAEQEGTDVPDTEPPHSEKDVETKLCDDETISSELKTSDPEKTTSSELKTSEPEKIPPFSVQSEQQESQGTAPPRAEQGKLGKRRKADPGTSRSEFLKLLMSNKDYEKQLLEEFAEKTDILSRLSSTNMKAVTGGYHEADESKAVVRDDHTVGDFKEMYKIQLPFPMVNESIVMPKHDYGPEWDRLIHRIYDSDYLEGFHLNYPRRDSVDVYAENLMWIRDLLENLIQRAENIAKGATVDVVKFIKTREHEFIDTLVKKEFRGSLLQRVRNSDLFVDVMYEDEISFTSKDTHYSPYFTTGFTAMKENRIVAAQVTLASSLLFLKLTDDALQNGRLLCCLAYGHLGLTLAAKFYSLMKEQHTFNALELLYHQRLVTALYRLAIYADLGGKVLEVFDEVTSAFKCVDVIHKLHGEEPCPKGYVPESELMKFIENLRETKSQFSEDRQLLWERHFMVILRSLRTINYYTDHMYDFSELKTLQDRNSPALANILDTLVKLDTWEDHLSFYTSHNLAARLLHYKAQIVSFIAEFVTDYQTCYQYALTKIVRAIELEQKKVPNIDVVFHRQCVNSFKVTQLDAALRTMWEIQSTKDVHETITLLQRVVDPRMPSWVLRKNEDCAFSILSSIFLLDYLSGLTNYLSKTHIENMRLTAFEYLKEVEWNDSLRDAACSVIWDKLEKLDLVKKPRTLEETLRLLKIGYYILPILMFHTWARNPAELKEVYNAATRARTVSLTEVKESYTETKDPNFCFGQKMLHDFSRNWSATHPTVNRQNSWPKPWQLDNTNEFECGVNKKVYFMPNKPVPTEVLESFITEYNDQTKPEGNISRSRVQKKTNPQEFQSALGARTAQYVIRSNDFELEIMKEELMVVLHDNSKLKIENYSDFVDSLMDLLNEVESELSEYGNKSKLEKRTLEEEQYSEWHKCVKDLLDDLEQHSGEPESDTKGLKILFHIALTFGFPIEQYMKNMP